jgi:hypothetical protein
MATNRSGTDAAIQFSLLRMMNFKAGQTKRPGTIARSRINLVLNPG